MIGASGTYAINNTDLALQPTEGRWLPREQYGVDGGGHPIYSAVRSFELSWQLISQSDFQQIVNFYDQVSNTGTCSVDLPRWGDTQYIFTTYSGCTLSEPQVSSYFNEHTMDAKLLILNIRTS